MPDITENLIHTSDAVASLSSSDESQRSSSTPTPTPTKHAPKNDPPGRLDGKLKNHKLIHIPPTKNDKTSTRKCRECVKKYQERNYISLCSVWCSSASRRLLHTISPAETLLKVCSKFQQPCGEILFIVKSVQSHCVYT